MEKMISTKIPRQVNPAKSRKPKDCWNVSLAGDEDGQYRPGHHRQAIQQMLALRCRGRTINYVNSGDIPFATLGPRRLPWNATAVGTAAVTNTAAAADVVKSSWRQQRAAIVTLPVSIGLVLLILIVVACCRKRRRFFNIYDRSLSADSGGNHRSDLSSGVTDKTSISHQGSTHSRSSAGSSHPEYSIIPGEVFESPYGKDTPCVFQTSIAKVRYVTVKNENSLESPCLTSDQDGGQSVYNFSPIVESLNFKPPEVTSCMPVTSPATESTRLLEETFDLGRPRRSGYCEEAPTASKVPVDVSSAEEEDAPQEEEPAKPIFNWTDYLPEIKLPAFNHYSPNTLLGRFPSFNYRMGNSSGHNSDHKEKPQLSAIHEDSKATDVFDAFPASHNQHHNNVGANQPTKDAQSLNLHRGSLTSTGGGTDSSHPPPVRRQSLSFFNHTTPTDGSESCGMAGYGTDLRQQMIGGTGSGGTLSGLANAMGLGGLLGSNSTSPNCPPEKEDQFWIPPAIAQKKRAQSLIPQLFTRPPMQDSKNSSGALNKSPPSSSSDSIPEMTIAFPLEKLTESPTLIQYSRGNHGRRRASMQDALDYTKINASLYETPPADRFRAFDFPSIQEEHLGSINFSISYNPDQSLLTVRLIQARDLVPRDFSGTADPFCRLCLLPMTRNQLQSRVHKKTLNPEFEEEFIFEVSPTDLQNRTLEILMYDYDQFSQDECVGQIRMALDPGPLCSGETVTSWKGLSTYARRTEEECFGDLMFSMAYLPSAQRLTVAIIKARKLKLTNDAKNIANPYVRVSLIVDSKRKKRKKTSTKRNTTNPVWNEAIVFNVEKHQLETIQLEFVVISDNLLGNNESLGEVIVGRNTSGEELSHWNDVLNLKNAMARWHHLQCSANSS